MKKFTKDLWVSAVNGFWGRALLILVALIGVQQVTEIVLPENSGGDESSVGNAGIIGILENLVGAFARYSLLILIYAYFILIYAYWLLMEKMRVDIIKEQNKNEAEIKKLELEKEILELQLQKENPQSPPKSNENRINP